MSRRQPEVHASKPADTAAYPPSISLMLESATPSLFFATYYCLLFQLAGQGGPSLVDAKPTVGWPTVVAVAPASAAEVESAASGAAIVTEPTTKLSGELGAVFRKVRRNATEKSNKYRE